MIPGTSCHVPDAYDTRYVLLHVSLFVYSSVGGGTHESMVGGGTRDNFFATNKQLYR